MSSELPAAAPPRLLIVEDDVRLCRLVKDYLETMGYTVAMVHTGPAGLKLALEEPFHAIVLDVMLPGMDGFEVLRQLRIHSTVPVLMLTGRGEGPTASWASKWAPTIIFPRHFPSRIAGPPARGLRRSLVTGRTTLASPQRPHRRGRSQSGS